MRYLIRCTSTTLVLSLMISSVSAQPNEQAPAPVVSSPAGISPEARAAVNKGVEQLNGQQYKEAVQTFLAAARRHPNNGQFRHLLGLAYLKDNQPGPAWLQFRQGVRFNPDYKPGQQYFLALWKEFERKGVLAIGRSQEEIVKLIGAPDRKVGTGPQTRLEYGFMQLHFLKGQLFAIADSRGLNAESMKPERVLKVEFDDQSRWKLGYRAIDKRQSLTEYVPKGQSVREWKELYTVQRLHRLASKTTPKKMATEIEANLRKENPDIDFQVLNDTENDVMFHWREKGSKERPAQHEIVRLVAGPKDIHRLAYGQRVAQIKGPEAEAWFQRMQNTKLIASVTPSTKSSKTSEPADEALAPVINR